MGKPRLWTKHFLINSLINFFIYLTYYLLMLIMTVYAADEFHASSSQAGLASGIFIIGALAGRLFSGISIERVGMKRMLYFGLSFFLLTTLFYFFVNNLLFLFIVRFLHGAGFGAASTATGTIVSKIIPNERRGEGTGYFAMSTTVASAIGPFLGIYLSQSAHYESIFIMCTLILLICFFSTFFLRVPQAAISPEKAVNIKGFRLTGLIERNALPIAFISIFMGASYSVVLSFLSSFTIKIGLVNAGSFFFIIYSLFILISRPFTGVWFDKKGENMVMYPAFLAFSAGLFMLSQVHHGFLLLFSAAFIGIGFGTFMSSAQAISAQTVPPHRMGLAVSTFFIFVDGGIGLGPFLFGFIIPVFGFRGVYAIASVVVFACLFLYFYLHGREARQKKSITQLTYE